MMLIARLMFWLIYIMLTYLFLVPQQYLASEIFDWSDKLQHSLAFSVLTILGLIAYGRTQKQVGGVVIALVFYGALIELLQSISGWRHGDFRDWLADILGVFIAWGIFNYLQKQPYISKFLKAS